MRLVSCEIAGFGRIKNLNIDFTKGLNAFLEENGWGKTTFSVFLKAMFFGMEYSRKRALSEREHYRPWDGNGVYGGSLTFSVDGRRYRIERTFGRKDTDDTFALYDGRTGLPSEDYSPAIGQELFQVDRDSFEKSIFIPQNSLATGMTDSLNAKMGDMVSAQDDINNFDAAIRRLEEAKRVYTKNSRLDPGRLIAVRQEIRSCREASEQIPAVTDALEQQQKVLEEKRSQLSALRKDKEVLLAQIAEQSKREQELGVYREKKETFEKLNQEFIKMELFFGHGVPDRKLLDQMDELERRLEVDGTHLAVVLGRLPSQERIERLKRLFADGIIAEEQIGLWNEKAQRLHTIRLRGEHAKLSEGEKEQLAELTAYFAKRNPSTAQLQQAMLDAAELAQLDGQVEALDEQCRNAKAKAAMQREQGRDSGEPRGTLYGMLVAAVLLAGAAVFGIFLRGTLGNIFAAVCLGAAIVIIGLIAVGIRRRRKAEAELTGTLDAAARQVSELLESKRLERDRQKEVCKAFLSGFLVSPADTYAQMIGEIQRKKESYEHLSAQETKVLADASEIMEELSALQIELYTELTLYAEQYGMDLYEDHREEELLDLLKEDKKDYLLLCENEQERDRLQKSIQESRERLEGFLNQFSTKGESEKEKLLEIRKKTDHHLTTQSTMQTLKTQLEEFEEHHQIDDETKSVIVLQQEEARTDEEIGKLNQQLMKAQELENELSDQLVQLEETEDRLDALMEREQDYKRKLEQLEKTIFYLTRAKEQFLARYMGPLRDGLRYYLSLIGEEGSAVAPDAADFTLDMDLAVRLTYKGSRKEVDYLSSGYQDLVSVCARLALADVLYRREEPFLILDDPFANLDGAKVERAMALLEKLAKTRQIIYFTCHASRMLDKAGGLGYTK